MLSFFLRRGSSTPPLHATKMLSIEEMAAREYAKDKCIYKRAHAMAFDSCYICDGFDYNCESYLIQLEAKQIQKEVGEDLSYLNEDGSE